MMMMMIMMMMFMMMMMMTTTTTSLVYLGLLIFRIKHAAREPHIVRLTKPSHHSNSHGALAQGGPTQWGYVAMAVRSEARADHEACCARCTLSRATNRETMAHRPNALGPIDHGVSFGGSGR